MKNNILAIDEGTTSCRAMVISPEGQVLTSAQQEFAQSYPENGWVEHDPIEIWRVTSKVCCDALSQLSSSESVIGIGITNQRETVVLWDKRTGQPVYPAIVWQDRRTANRCRDLVASGHESLIRERTGLRCDPYFSATKVEWVFEHVSGVRSLAKAGHIALGTIDTWLIWNFTNGGSHVTDATNASRTMLFNIHTQTWDQELLNLFNIPESALPSVLDSAADFGIATSGLAGILLPIAGVAGDQHAAMVGQACFKAGMIKSTYGTGCFALMNLGGKSITSTNHLLTTVAYRLNNQVTYALEGTIFNAGTSVQWLRDKLSVIDHANETEDLAASLDSNNGVYLVPAFTGLGAPHWEPDARAMICGLTRASGKAEMARAALEAVCYQTRNLLEAMLKDSGRQISELRIDGGMVVNNWLHQALADITERPVLRPKTIETSVLGAARLAGLELRVFEDIKDLENTWHLDKRCEPKMSPIDLAENIKGWERAVKACKAFTRSPQY